LSGKSVKIVDRCQVSGVFFASVTPRTKEESKMPDGDKFERGLRGFGWRKAYRLACNNSPLDLVGDILMKAVAYALRNQLACSAISKIEEAILKALKDASSANLLNFEGKKREDPFYSLSLSLEKILAAESNSLPAQLASAAAQATYLELEEQSHLSNALEVKKRLSLQYAKQIISNQWLDRVREGVAEKQNRSSEQQMGWEKRLIENVERRLLKTPFKLDGKSTVRAPRSITPKMKMTLDELNRGLVVLEV
jgi:hypothetical protein